MHHFVGIEKEQMLAENFSPFQLFGFVGLGAFFWGVGVTTIRYGSSILFGSELRRIGSFISAIPMAYATIRVSEELLSVDPRQRLAATAIIACVALLLDGAALMWYPTLYENPSLRKKNSFASLTFSRMGAAWLLWTFGLNLFIGLFT